MQVKCYNRGSMWDNMSNTFHEFLQNSEYQQGFGMAVLVRLPTSCSCLVAIASYCHMGSQKLHLCFQNMLCKVILPQHWLSGMQNAWNKWTGGVRLQKTRCMNVFQIFFLINTVILILLLSSLFTVPIGSFADSNLDQIFYSGINYNLRKH